jgi:hypothetical protein
MASRCSSEITEVVVSLSPDHRNLVSDVFVTVGQPTITYVKRSDGQYEKAINRALDERGQLCLITGPSKTGKTTLYKNVLTERGEIPLVIRCSKGLSCKEIWRQALERIDFSRTVSRSSAGAITRSAEFEASGEGGWAFLAKISAKFKRVVGSSQTDSEVIERVLAEPSADLLVDVLKNINHVLVIEDFHYLSEESKIELFQQWKQFTDEGVTVIVVETSHRAVDIANSNKDLIGRIAHVDCQNWDLNDLRKICTLGMNELKKMPSKEVVELIVRESVGLPILTQQICLEIFELAGVKTVSEARSQKIPFSVRSVKRALNSVASTRYSTFNSYYNTIVKGPREKSRKYSTYEIVVACFTVDPLMFSMSRREIAERINKMGLDANSTPPSPSINSTLGALAKFQERRGLELLEWRPSESVLHILEPTFLFYIRWRSLKDEMDAQLNFLGMLLDNIRSHGNAIEESLRDLPE